MDNDSSDNNNNNNVKIPKNSITSCIEKKDKSKDLEEQKKKHILKKTDNFNLKNNNLLNEYSCLKGYVFRNFYETRNYNEICSISENKFIKLIKKNENEIIKYNQKNPNKGLSIRNTTSIYQFQSFNILECRYTSCSIKLSI